MTWTQELIDQIVADWRADKSVDRIAKDRHLTRNQVSGKINRLRMAGVELEERGEPASLRRSNKKAKPLPDPGAGGCLWIEGNPIEEIRAGRDPHCGAPRRQNSPYCDSHHAHSYIAPKRRLA